MSGKLKIFFSHAIVVGIIVALLTIPITTIITLKVTGWFQQREKQKNYSTKPEITVQEVSITTIDRLYEHDGKYFYYEITPFKIVNTGTKPAKKGDKIQFHGSEEILGVSPKTLISKFEIDKNDNTKAFIDISGLEPTQIIAGAIHSLAKMYHDSNVSPIGLDSVPPGSFNLNGPNSF